MSRPNFDMARLAHLVSDKTLSLIIMPTEACNFRCTYCYEDFSIGRMPLRVTAGIKALLDRRAPDLDHLEINFFGGEPLVAKNIVLDLATHAATLAAAYPHLSYDAGATTNGYLLTPDTLSQLAAVGVRRYQISLDGPRDVHNRSRVRADGRGTFDRIWENLIALRDSAQDVSVLLRIHFDATTFALMDELIESVKREFLPDARFSIFFHPIERLGGPNDSAIGLLESSAENAALTMLKRKLYGPDTIEPEDEPFVCYAARPNSLLIRADGRIGKCTVALYDERNHIGHLRPDGTLDIMNRRLTPWLRGLPTLDSAVLECPLRNLPVVESAGHTGAVPH